MKPETFKRLRQAMGLEQRELASLLGIGKGYVSHLEIGAAPITDKRAAQLVELFKERSGDSGDEAYSIMAGIFRKKC